MFGNGQLACCQQRKEELLRQSLVNRQLLEQDSQRLRGVAEWVDVGIEVTRKARVAWDVAGPLLAFWRMRRQGSSGFAQKVALGAWVAQSLPALWKTSQGTSQYRRS